MSDEDQDLYTLVLKQALENYEQAIAWSKPEAGLDYHSTSLSRLAFAEAQTAVLEIFNCGQVGGFDHGQTDRSLKARLDWLRDRGPVVYPRASLKQKGGNN